MTIDFAPDGTARCLYGEDIDLTALGHLDVERVSRVEFNATTQQWAVRNTAGSLLFAHRSRQACLDWEHAHPEKLIA